MQLPCLGDQVCVAHRHVDVIAALAQGSSAAATEMRKHLTELERSLTDSKRPAQQRLRDAFSGYRDTLNTDRKFNRIRSSMALKSVPKSRIFPDVKNQIPKVCRPPTQTT